MQPDLKPAKGSKMRHLVSYCALTAVLLTVLFLLYIGLEGIHPNSQSSALQAVKLSLVATIWTLITSFAMAVFMFPMFAYATEASVLQGSFRLEILATNETWLALQLGIMSVAFAGIFDYIGGNHAGLFDIAVFNSDKYLMLFFAIVLALAFVIGLLLINLLRYLQYMAVTLHGTPVPPYLAQGISEISPVGIENAVRKGISENTERLDRLEAHLLKDEQVAAEIGWCERYIERMRIPRLYKPADIWAIDSQTAVRFIYPAALLLWSEQISQEAFVRSGEKSTSNYSWENVSGSEEVELWKAKFAEFLLVVIDGCQERYDKLRQDSDQRISSSLDMRLLRSRIASGLLSARILIYDIETLRADVVRAVIDFHSAVGVPLFFIPVADGPKHSGKVALGSSDFSEEHPAAIALRDYNELLSSVSGKIQFARIPNLAKIRNSKEAVWRSSNDDFIIIDGAAWCGYPDGKKKDGQSIKHPVPELWKFVRLLSSKYLLLAAHARALACNEDGKGVLSKWVKSA